MYVVRAAVQTCKAANNNSHLAYVVLLLAIALVAAACSRAEVTEVKGVADFEMSCRLSGFSWITKQPQEGGVELAAKPCLGCTTNVDNHFCNEKDFAEAVAVLSDFRDACKANSDTWMLMQPTINNAMPSEKMCWGCMADEHNHICSKEEYLKFKRLFSDLNGKGN